MGGDGKFFAEPADAEGEAHGAAGLEDGLEVDVGFEEHIAVADEVALDDGGGSDGDVAMGFDVGFEEAFLGAGEVAADDEGGAEMEGGGDVEVAFVSVGAAAHGEEFLRIEAMLGLGGVAGAVGDLEDGTDFGGEFGGVVVTALGSDFGSKEGLGIGAGEELDGGAGGGAGGDGGIGTDGEFAGGVDPASDGDGFTEGESAVGGDSLERGSFADRAIAMDHDFAAEVAVVAAGEGAFGDEDFFFDAAAGILDGRGDEDAFLTVMVDAEVGGGVGSGG